MSEIKTQSAVSWYYVQKEYYDLADDIEGVNIHYVCTPVSAMPDWDSQRTTRYMPLVRPTAQMLSQSALQGSPESANATRSRLRKKLLKLPQQLLDPQTDTQTSSYLLHYYFEIFQDGHRRYSPLYTEEIITTATRHCENEDPVEQTTAPNITAANSAAVKEPSK